MEDQKQALIRKAQESYSSILPCKGKLSVDDCFTQDDDKLMLWFNTEDRSTHVLVCDVKGHRPVEKTKK